MHIKIKYNDRPGTKGPPQAGSSPPASPATSAEPTPQAQGRLGDFPEELGLSGTHVPLFVLFLLPWIAILLLPTQTLAHHSRPRQALNFDYFNN